MAGNAFTLVLEAVDNASKVFDGVSSSVAGTASASEKTSAATKLALAAAGGAALAFGKASIDAYGESEQSAIALQDAFSRFPALADSNISAFQDLNSELAKKTRYDDDATASGQAVLAQFGLTGQQVLQLTPLMQDYAAKTGKSLTDAASDFGKATLGQGKALKEVGIDFQDTGTAAGNLDELTAGLRSQVAGFAEKDGKTAAGQAEILGNSFGEIQEAVGAKLVPALIALSGMLTQVTDFIGANSDTIIPLVAVLGTFAAVIYTILTVTRIWTAVQTAFNIVMGLNPIVLITLAIIALIAIIVIAYQNSETFRDIVNGAFNAVLTVIKAVWQWVSDNWPLLLAILTGPIGLAVLAIVSHWDEIKDGFTKVKDWIGDKIGEVVGFFTALPGRITGAVSGMFDGVKNAFASSVNWIIQKWNDLSFSLGGGSYDPLGKYGPTISVPKFTFDTPNMSLLSLSQGGLAVGTTFAQIGDNPSKRELVLPEEKWAAYGITKGGNNDGGGRHLHVHFDGNVYADKSQLAIITRDAFREAVRLGFIQPGELAAI